MAQLLEQGISSKGFQYRKQGTSTYTSLSTSSTPLQVNINNLSSSTTYEYRLYAVSSIGTTYSNTEIFMTDCGVVSPPLTENFESPLNCWTNISSKHRQYRRCTVRRVPILYSTWRRRVC